MTLRKGVCPVAWHIPSDSDWSILVKTFEADTLVGTGYAGSALQSREGWQSFSPTVSGKDLFGFHAITAGARNTWGAYDYAGQVDGFWVPNESASDNAIARLLDNELAYIQRGGMQKTFGASVRCLQD